TKWIDEGAKFDGRSTSTPLVRLISSTPGVPSMAEPTELTVVPATGSETVSYSRDIAPVLLSTCVECHTASRQSGGLCLDNFQLVLKGGESGAMLSPGEPADSLLIKKLKGMAGQRMPLNRDPLPGNVIAKFEKWIEEGAKFDGGDPSLSTPIMIRNFRIRTLSHEQLAKDRIESSQQKWRLTSP